MAAAPFLRRRDVERLVATYRARLVETGVASDMAEPELAERLDVLRTMLVSMTSPDAGTWPVATTGPGREVHVSGVAGMVELRPVRDACGRIDVERSVADVRLLREMTTTELARRVRVPWWLQVTRPVGWVVTRLFFRDAAASYEHVLLQADEMVREGYRQQQADEDGRSDDGTVA